MQVPSEFIQTLIGLPGFDAAAFEAVHASSLSVTSVRRNPSRMVKGVDPVRELQEQAVPWCSNGYYLSRRPSFTLDPLFHAGAYYVQEASSMFLETVCKQTVSLEAPLLALDLCAAPGGKSTLLQSILSADSLLISNEVIQSRVHVLKENLIKWGGSNVVVTHNDPRDFQQCSGLFDLMVVDAPCSGSGLFRRDPEAISEWSLSNVQLCFQRQQRILADAWEALKENGVLIYSTCSFSSDENEGILDWLLTTMDADSLRIRLDESWKIEEVQSKKGGWGYRFWPHKVMGEGFFIAAFRKRSTPAATRIRSKQSFAASRSEIAGVSKWIRSLDAFELVKQGQNIAAVPVRWAALIQQLMDVLKVRYAGVETGMMAKNDLIPDHALALSHLISDSIPFVELERETALEYLRKNEIPVMPSQKGWVLVRYEGLNLGWMKHLGNRINNYYPKEYRILMSK